MIKKMKPAKKLMMVVYSGVLRHGTGNFFGRRELIVFMGLFGVVAIVTVP